MRPLELRLRGFRSYFGDETVIDFRGRRLVGIVGPIGSGKSSLLNAISYALYGRTPSVDRDVRSLIHQRADGAVVTLRFEVDGDVWEATRALRRKGQSQHSLRRLAADADDTEATEKITGKKEVDARVVELLGLEFDAFSRSVLLAQGRFAEFLRAPPRERDSVLKGVFGHDRIDAMKAAAHQRAHAAATELEVRGRDLSHLQEAAARLEGQQAQLEELEQRIAALEATAPAYEALQARINDAHQSASAHRERLAELTEAGERLPTTAEVDEITAAAKSADEQRERLGTRLEEAQQHLAAAEERQRSEEEALRPVLEEADRRWGAREQLARRAVEAADRLRQIRQQVADLARRGAAAAEESAAAEEALTAAAADLEAAKAAVAVAEEDLHRARHDDMAAALRAGLVVGEPCPVCARPVAELPEPGAAAALEPLERALRHAQTAMAEAADAHGAAQRRLERGRAAADEAQRALATAEEALSGAEAAERDAAAELAATDERLTELLGPGDAAERLEQVRRRLVTLGSDVTAAREAVRRIRQDHDAAIERQQQAAKRLAEVGALVGELAVRIGGRQPPGSEAGPDALAEAVAGVRRAWDEAVAATRRTIDVATSDAGAATDELEELQRALGLDEELPTALAKARGRAEALVEEIGQLTERVAALDEVRAEIAALEATTSVYQRLATDLTDAKFVRFLLDDERARLADLGSDHFQRLSSGRYRFSADGSFEIVDLTAAEAVRKADSLSGGETFLASLALALALAEMVSRTGGRLDAFFLDEGFGTLDPEHLDLAMEGVEQLVAATDRRLVVIVSHVPELRERIEDLIVLDRSPLTGDTRVLRS